MSLWEFAVRRWQFSLVMLVLLVALGVVAVSSIPREEDPGFAIPLTSVIVNFPGADPLDMERLAVDPIEDAIAELEDVKEIRSSSEDGLGVIRVEFDWSVDADRKYDEVVREVNALRARLPRDIREIVIRKTNPSLVNIVQYALLSDDSDRLALKRSANDLEEVLESVPGIRRAEAWANPQPEVRVALDLPRMAELGLDIGAVFDAVEGEGSNIPGGAVDIGSRRYNLKTSGDYGSVEAVGETVLASRNGGLIRLRDVAEIGWATAAENYLGRFNGKPAAFVTANMKEGENIFAVQALIDQRVAGFKAQLPASITLETGFVQALNVEQRLDHLGRDFLIALLLVSITLLPLGLRAAGIVMVAIPLSLAIGLAGMWLLGFSLNQMSIAGFVVALGLLVDDAIVVVENIARHLRDGKDRVLAAIQATDQIAMAVLGCTVTLLLAFLPLLNLPEGAGKFTRGLPLAVALTVAASLAVAFTIVPFLASQFLPRDQHPQGNLFLRLLQRGIHAFYAPLVQRALRSPRTTLAIAFALFAASLLLVPRLGFSLFPPSDKPQFLISIQAAEGSSLANTDRALRFVEAELARHPEATQVMSNLGQGNPLIYYNVIPREERSTTAEVFVGLERWRGKQSERLLEQLRQRFDQYPDARIVVKRFENGPPIEAPIAVRIIGPDLDVLRGLAAQAEQRMSTVPGTRDVSNPLRLPRIDLNLGIDLDKAGLLGIASRDVDRAVRLAIAGYPASTYRDTLGDEYDVTLRLPMNQRPTAELLTDLRFSSRTSGRAVPLSQIASPHLESGPNRIQRHNRERMVTVTAYAMNGHVISGVSRAVYATLETIALPGGYRIEAGGEAEAASSSLGGLGAAMLVAILGIVAVLVLEFGSFRSTLIVAGVVPFGILGALFALFISGQSLSYVAIIGFVALTGIEIKNSILLVDFTNQLREDGMPLDEAIRSAGELRFLPVLLTSVTAIGGLLPLALAGTTVYAPLAIVIIGGVISSTLLARIVTPVMYKLLPPALDRG